jgi:hypothetical protein
MAMIRAVLHTYQGTPDDPPTVLQFINRHFRYLWDTAMYATAAFAILDVERHIPELAEQEGEGILDGQGFDLS